jgi:hypothetical protein
VGANIYAFTTNMGVTKGLLTSDARNDLLEFEPPTALSLFDPLSVPEVANGRWWDPSIITGLGTSGFKIAERNGGTTEFDFVQTDTTKQPAVITTNGFNQLAFGGSGGGNDAVATIATAGPMGWTGATMVAYWGRLPNGVTGTTQFFRHLPASGSRRLLAGNWTASNRVRFTVSHDGTAAPEYSWDPGDVSNWHYYEWVFDPFEPVATARQKLYVDRRLLTPTVTATTSTTLFDPVSCRLDLCSSNLAANANDTEIGGAITYTNGIPSNANRDRLYRQFKPPRAA